MIDARNGAMIGVEALLRSQSAQLVIWDRKALLLQSVPQVRQRLAVLQALGINAFQGWQFARALPAPELRPWLAKHGASR